MITPCTLDIADTLPSGHLKDVLSLRKAYFGNLSVSVGLKRCPAMIMELTKSCLACQNEFHALICLVKGFLCLWVLTLYFGFDHQNVV